MEIIIICFALPDANVESILSATIGADMVNMSPTPNAQQIRS